MSTVPTTPAADAPRAAEFSEAAVHAALVSGTRPPRPGAVSNAIAFGWRGMLKIKHVPEQLLDVTVTPVLFLVMFTYLFGGAVSGSTDEYLQYILPGILAQSVLFTSVYSGVTLNTDMTKGVVDRFRSLPVWRPAPLVGAVLGDAVRYTLAACITIGVGLILGYDAEGGVLGLVGGIGLIVAFAFALSWVFTTLGLILRSQNAVMNAGFMGVFPLLFLSNIFVDPSTLPAGLEAFVDVNPISHLVTAMRGVMGGSADGGDIALVFAEAAVIVAIFAPLTARLYGRAQR